MKPRLIQLGIAIIFITLAGFVFQKSILSTRPTPPLVKSMKSWQQADAPLGFPVEGSSPEFDPRMIRLSAFQRARIPTALHFSAPLGSENGALTYNAQPFWSDNVKRGGHHTGDDINGIGGMNSDLGDPVYAVSHGLVIYRGTPSAGWGNTVILAHRTREGGILLSMYAHLEKIFVAYEEIVNRGRTIGTVGSANGRYLAHLHFEMRDSTSPFIGRGYASVQGVHLNPGNALKSMNDGPPRDLYSPPLKTMLLEQLNTPDTNFSTPIQ